MFELCLFQILGLKDESMNDVYVSSSFYLIVFFIFLINYFICDSNEVSFFFN